MTDRPFAYIVCPFDDEKFGDNYWTIASTVENLGYRPFRADQSILTGNVNMQMRAGITDARFIIADLSDEGNCNVYHEVGLAQGAGKDVFLVAKHGTQLAFAVRNDQFVLFKSMRDLSRRLEQAIFEHIGIADDDTQPPTPEPAVQELDPFEAELAAAATDWDRVQVLLRRAGHFRALDRDASALKALEAAYAIDPRVPDVLAELSRRYNETRAHDRGLEVARELQEREPADHRGHGNAAFALNALGRYEEACVAVQKALELKPGDPSYGRMREYARRNLGGGPQVSTAGVDDLYAVDPAETELTDFLEMIDNLGELRQHDEALSRTDARLETCPDLERTVLLTLRGQILSRLGRKQEAIDALAAAVRLDGGHWQAHFEIGSILLEAGETLRGIQALRKTLECAVQDPNALNQIGYTLSRNRDNRNALLAYEMALDFAPEHVPVMLNYGFALNLERRNDDALAVYDQIVVLNPGNARAHIERAYTLSLMRRYPEALEAVMEGLNIDPRNPRGVNVRAGIESRMR